MTNPKMVNTVIIYSLIIMGIVFIFDFSFAQNNNLISDINSNNIEKSVFNNNHSLSDRDLGSQKKIDLINNSIVAAIIGSLITIIPTWLIANYNHKTSIDKEAVNLHFEDIKKHIVSNMLYILKNHPDRIPSLQEIEELDEIIVKVYPPPENMTDNQVITFPPIIFDGNICRDLLKNHYPKLKDHWKSFSENLELKSKNKDLLLKHLNKYLTNIPIIKDNNTIKIDLIIELLFKMFDIRDIEYDLEILDKDNNFIILFNTKSIINENIDRKIFRTNNREICIKIRQTLSESLDKILKDDVKVNNYKELTKEYQNSLNLFYNDFKFLKYATKLKNEKKWLKIKCKFIKSQI